MKSFELVTLAFLCAVSASRSQSLSTRGTDFWLTFMENSSLPTRTLFVSAQEPAAVTVSIGGQVIARVDVAANGSERVEVTDARSYQSKSDEICRNCAVRVQSTAPISLYAFNSVNQSTDATIVLPVPALGDRYTVASYPHYFIRGMSWSSLFTVVGVQSNTVVEITPKAAVSSASLGQRPARIPFRVTLNAGDVVQLKSLNANEDLTGSTVKLISSGSDCGKVAVFSGHQRTAIPIDDDNNRDHLFEQMPPIAALGKEYVVPPLRQAIRYNIRVISSEANTTIKIDGIASNLVSADAVIERTDMDATVHHTVEANKPVMVVLYAQSTPDGWQGVGAIGDPMMIVIPPISQRIDNATIYAFVPNQQPGWEGNTFVTIITPTSGLSRVRYDGYERENYPAFLGSVESVEDVGRGNSVVILRVRPGVHTFDASANGGLFALIHGLAKFDSYGFVAGTSYSNLRTSIIGQAPPFCPGKPIQLRGFNSDSVNILSWRWVFHDGKTADGQETSRIYGDTGTFTVKLVMQRTDCGADTAFTTIRITNPLSLAFNVVPAPVCVDSVAVISATLLPSQANVGYTWRALDDNGIVAATNEAALSIRHSRPGLYRYVLTATDEGGCSAQDTVAVSVIPQPSIALNDRYLICEGADLDIAAVVTDTAATTTEWAAENLEDVPSMIGDRTRPTLKVRLKGAGDHAFVISATNKYGCTQQKRVVVTVVESPKASLSGSSKVYSCLDESIPPVEIGADIVVTGGVPPYRYAWAEQGGGTTSFRGSTTSLITQVKPKQTTTYVLTIRDANSQINCPTTILVTVEMRPVPDAKAGDDAVLCACDQGAKATLGIDARCGQPPYRYTWTPTTGLSNPQSTVTAVTEARPQVTTTYILSVSDATGTINYDTVVVRVEPCPDVVVAQPVAQCGNNTTYMLNASLRNSVENVTYTWEPTTYLDDPSSLRPTARVPSDNVVINYRLTARSPFGCVGTASVTLRHSSGPRLALTASHSCATDTLCRGESVTINAAVSGGVAPYALRWTATPELSPGWTSSASSIQVQPLQTTLFVVRATDSLGCQIVDSIRICVDPVPNVRTGTDTVICASDVGSSRIVRGLPSTCGKPPFVYEWAPAALVTVSDPSRPWEAILSPSQTTTFTLKVTDDGGSGISTVDSVRVTVRESLQLALTPDSLAYCPSDAPEAVSIRPSNGTAPYVITMIRNGVILDEQRTTDSVVLRPNLLPNVPGMHTVNVEVIDANGCRTADSLRIRVYEPPTVSIDAQRQICLCDSVTIRASGTSTAGGALRYVWSESSEDAPVGTTTLQSDSAATQLVRPTRGTTYTVVAIDQFGCSNRASFTIDVRSTIPGMQLAIDTVVANPKAANVAIPVKVVAANDSVGCPADAIQFDLRYNESLYEPFPRIEPGVITANTTMQDTNGVTWRTITVNVPPSPTLKNGDILCRIHGRALIGAPGETSLDIERARVVYGCDDVAINASDGVLKLDSLCITQDSIERLLDFNADAIRAIYPNPASLGFVNVDVSKKSSGSWSLVVADLAGRELYRHTFQANSLVESTVRISTPATPGLYQLFLRTASGISSLPFVVTKSP